MKKIVFLTFFFVSFYGEIKSQNSSKINIEIEIVNGKLNLEKSSAHGEKLIQYNNYHLFEVISKITNIPVKHFQIGNNVKNPIIRFKASHSSKIEAKNLTKVFFENLKEYLNIKLIEQKTKRKVKVLYSTNENKMDKCLDENEVSIIKVNRMLKAKCISSQKLIDIFNDWYGEELINGLDKNAKFNFEIHHANTFEELLTDLLYNYSIKTKVEELLVKEILIQNIN